MELLPYKQAGTGETRVQYFQPALSELELLPYKGLVEKGSYFNTKQEAGVINDLNSLPLLG